MNTTLTQEQMGHFHNNGFVIQENFLSLDELEYWKAAVTEVFPESKAIATGFFTSDILTEVASVILKG
jgi:hypothetical protein